jgi:hypothetical protein
MQSAVRALTWEFWSANRLGWLLVLAALVACGAALRLFAGSLLQSEELQFLSLMPLTAAIILAISFCNFTDRNRRDGIAGFPRHLFALPINTVLMVSCAMACSLLSVVGIYVAWATLVVEPLAPGVLIRWPATLLAAFVVFYQAIIWCLCGFRLTRVIALSLVATSLVAVGFLPALLPSIAWCSPQGCTSLWTWESVLTAVLGILMAAAYGATLLTVGAQRRGGARGWAGVQKLVDVITNAIPRRRVELKSPDAALFWMEWRRAGFVLPAAVLLTSLLILGPVLAFTGRDEKDTLWAETWLAIMPIMLAFPIGMGFGKPDFWSLDLTLPSFATTRPVTSGQLLTAKLKAAACSALTTWAVLLLVAFVGIYFYCDTTHWKHIGGSLAILYSPVSTWAVPALLLVAAILATWGLLVHSIWLGYSGRAGFYYSLTAIGLTLFVAGFFYLVWWLDHPRTRGDTFVGMLPWLPWALAAVVTTKVWFATLCASALRRRRLISGSSVAKYSCIWLGATACLVLCAWLMAPRIEWFRNTMMLAGLCAIPSASIVIAPLAIAWNRHR